MNKITSTLMVSLFLLLSSLNFAQKTNHFDEKPHVPNEMLVQVHANKSIKGILHRAPQSYRVELIEQLSPQMRIWLIKFDELSVSTHQMQAWLYNQPEVSIADYNYYVDVRSTLPGDPSFTQQWHHNNTGQTGGTTDADIDSDLAWDITTGGTTATNDDIVVCMVEGGGGNLNHQDLLPNAWVNTGEIDGNGIDDDGNGYVDDYAGWNTGSNNDNFGTGGHGTNCLGMIGAKGDNGLNVVGANWDVKLMVVNMGGGLTQANVIAAYTYPLTLRQQWNNSGGTEGAFVVATSASWGIDGANPASYPLWCNFYDTLGHYGILNVGATTNQNLDVDTAGDMPTACSSPYMIGVGRTDHNDNTAGGYGDQTIDFGAPGINVVTTSGTTGITTTTGTSFACPLTAGVIGLAYSIPCPSFMSLVQSNPQGAADMVLQALWDGVDPKTQLANKFVHGGRLNAKNTLDELMGVVCSGTLCLSPSSVSNSNITDNSADVSFTAYASGDESLFYWRPVGAATWTELSNATSPVNLTGLIGCTDYEYYMATVCGTDTSSFSSVQTFTTTGCGNCIDLSYCAGAATDGVDEWIDAFTIDSYTNNSGNDGGYGDYTGSGSIMLDEDATYNISLDIAWSGTLYDEQSRIWIDLDQSGTFDAGELVFDQGVADQSAVVTGTITIPPGTPLGSTRMRVQMAYLGSGQAALPDVCDSYTWGEVEDYCVEITQSVICGLTTTSTVTDPQCSGQDNGAVSVIVSGGSPGYTYDWGATAGDVDNVSGLAPGNYSVTITDGTGCDTIINYALSYQTSITLNSTGTNVSCFGAMDGSATTVASGSTGYSYQWTGGPATDTYPNLGPGSYTVTVTDANGCEAIDVISITEPVEVVAGFTQSTTSLTANLTNTSTGGTSYSWDFGDGTTSSTFNATHVYTTPGTYTVCLTANSTCGNDTTCQYVVVDNIGLLEDPNEFIKVYPNPASTEINFVISGIEVSAIEILDVVGKVIARKQVIGPKTKMDVLNYSDGAYFYRVLNSNNVILHTDKIIVRK